MIVDSSAIVAIHMREPGVDLLLRKIAEAEPCGIGAPTLLETTIVLTARSGQDALVLVARFLEEMGIVTISFGEDHWRAAMDAFIRFGKGRHPARLNFGDCMSYATALLAGQPLLCVGDDFSKTDIKLA